MKINYRIPLILGILIAAMNIIAFVIPVERTAVFILCDIFVVLALVAQLGFSRLAFGKNKSLRSKVYGWPIMRIGLMYLCATFVIALVLMLLPCAVELFTFSALVIFMIIVLIVCLLGGAFRAYTWKMAVIFAVTAVIACGIFYLVDLHDGAIPVWIGVVLFVICTAAAAVGMIAAAATRDSVERKLDDQVRVTAAMTDLRAQAEAICGAADDKEIKNLMKKVADDLKFSDPVTNERTIAYEQTLSQLVSDMATAVAKEDKAGLKKLIRQFNMQLSARNQACMLGKADQH